MARDLSPPATLGLYAAGLALVFVAALGVGRAVGPVGTTAPDHGGHSGGGTHSTGSTHADDGAAR